MMKEFSKKLKSLIYLPLRFPVLFLIFVLFFILERSISDYGVLLWPYSFCLFWNENEFYRVTNQKKYKFSFVRLMMKLKKEAKKKSKSMENFLMFAIPVLPLSCLALLFESSYLIVLLTLGYLAYQIDQNIQKRWLW